MTGGCCSVAPVLPLPLPLLVLVLFKREEKVGMAGATSMRWWVRSGLCTQRSIAVRDWEGGGRRRRKEGGRKGVSNNPW